MGFLYIYDMELKSTDYARLIQYAAQKLHMVRLNKTQINKILFYVYGVYYAETNNLLFKDDSPKVWPYGPVFPIVNKKINPDEIITSFPKDVLYEFNKHSKALELVKTAVNAMYNMSALSLTQWSHQEGSPWYDTLYIKNDKGDICGQNKWNTPIPKELIKNYFIEPKNRIKRNRESNKLFIINRLSVIFCHWYHTVKIFNAFLSPVEGFFYVFVIPTNSVFKLKNPPIFNKIV